MKKPNEYTAESIQSLDAIDGIRCRPEHIIGGTDEFGHFVILREIVDNALDEAQTGNATEVKVWLSDDCRSARVEDNGRGIPFEKHPKTGLSTLVTVFAFRETGAKFNNDSYGTSVGTHGIGATATNALSSKFKAQSFRGKNTAIADFAKGRLTTDDAVLSKTPKKRTGTVVEFTPDYEDIFKDVPGYDYSRVATRLKDAAALLPGVTVSLEFAGKTEVFPCSGIQGLLPENKESYLISAEFPVVAAEKEQMAKIDIAFAWGEGRNQSLVNLSRNVDGGVHLDGWQDALVEFMLQRGKNKCSSREILEGFDSVVYLHHPNPKFSSQTKEKVINRGLAKTISLAIAGEIKSWARKNAATVDAFLEKAAVEYQIRQEAKDVKKALKDVKITKRGSRGILPEKLFEADCKPAIRELYIVEGDSAAGSAVNGRDASFQEILPLKGKIINAFKANESEVIGNDEVAAIIAAVGGGFGSKFNIDQVRVGKIIILSDSDHDGYHITSLLLSLFAKYMTALLEKGIVYTVDAPLFKGSIPSTKTRWFAHTMEELKVKAGKDFKRLDVTRLKGHGEANPDEVAEYAMESTRKLVQLVWTDPDLKEMNKIMGEDIAGRKELLGI
jgi:DNA gyrase/topoisomerase IV subunit B